MSSLRPRIVQVRSGGVCPSGSWVYVWIDIDTGWVVYVGGTGFDPELRTHLHLTDADPNVGRVKALVSDADRRSFDVLAFPLPADVARPAAKDGLLVIHRLIARGLYAGDDPSGAAEACSKPMADAVEEYLAQR